MADLRIIALPDTSTVADADEFIIDSSSAGTRRVTWNEVKVEVAADLVAAPLTYKLVPLNGSNKIDVTYLPTTGDTPKGDWLADNTAPVLTDGTGTAGDYYDVTDANSGTIAQGAGTLAIDGDSVAVGDRMKYDGTNWYIVPQVSNLFDGTSTQAGAATTGDYYQTADVNDRALSKTPANALRFDQTASVMTGAGSITTLIGLSDFTIAWEMAYPVAGASDEYIFEEGTLNLRIQGSTNDYLIVRLNSTDYSIPYAITAHDEVKSYVVTGDRSGNATLYIDGVSVGVIDISAQVAHTITGSGYSINSTNASNTTDFTLYSFIPFNRLLTASEVLRLSIEGTIPVADQWGGADIYTADFTSDSADGWTASAGAVDATTTVGSDSDNIQFTTDNSASSAHRLFQTFGSSLVANRRYRLSFQYYVPSGNSNIDGFEPRLYNGSTEQETTAVSSATTDAWTTYQVEFVITAASFNRIFIYAMDGGSKTFTDAGGDDTFAIRPLAGVPFVEAVGCVAAFEGRNIESSTWRDSSSNELNGTITGATRLFEPMAQASGTWTPTITFGGASVNLTYTSQEGHWTRLTEKAYLMSGKVVINSNGDSTGTAAIAGLPYVAANYTEDAAIVPVRMAACAGLTSSPFGVVNNNGTTITLSDHSATGAAVLSESNLIDGCSIAFNFVYEIE